MARADLILSLVKSGSAGDLIQFRKAVEALAADERAKRHTLFADRILDNLSVGSDGAGGPKPRVLGGVDADPKGLFFERIPARSLSDLLLPQRCQLVIGEMVEEQLRSDLLRAYNLEPRHRVLLFGPPGNGKTSLAEALADALNVPVVTVRYESIIGSYLGETAQRVGQVFDYARSRKCVLFLDEFDAIAKERGAGKDTGEIERVVNSLLLQIDSLPSYVVAVAASNRPELLDRAVWRRFQLHLELPLPGPAEIASWFRCFERRTGYQMSSAIDQLSESLYGVSFAEVEEFGLDVVRRAILSEPGADVRCVVRDRLRRLSDARKGSKGFYHG